MEKKQAAVSIQKYCLSNIENTIVEIIDKTVFLLLKDDIFTQKAAHGEKVKNSLQQKKV